MFKCVCATQSTQWVKTRPQHRETPCLTLYDECAGSLTSLADHNSEDAGDRAGIDISIDSQLNFDECIRVGRHLTDYQPTVDQASTVY